MKQNTLGLQFEHSGHRLSSLQVFNWGTFDKKVWTLNFAGEGSLLTGENGSGKSTLVDALLTLLVPNKKRNYRRNKNFIPVFLNGYHYNWKK